MSCTANETITIGTPRISDPEPQTVKDKLNVASLMAMIGSLQKELQEIKQKQHEDAVLLNDMKDDMRSIYTTVNVINSSITGMRANAPPGDIAAEIQKIGSNVTNLNRSMDTIMKIVQDEIAREEQSHSTLPPSGSSKEPDRNPEPGPNRQPPYRDVVTTIEKGPSYLGVVHILVDRSVERCAIDCRVVSDGERVLTSDHLPKVATIGLREATAAEWVLQDEVPHRNDIIA